MEEAVLCGPTSHLLNSCFKAVGFPAGSDGKASVSNAGDPGSIPGSGRSPGEGNGNPLQYSRLENPTDRGAWWATVHGATKSRTRLSDFTLLQGQAEIAIRRGKVLERIHDPTLGERTFTNERNYFGEHVAQKIFLFIFFFLTFLP